LAAKENHNQSILEPPPPRSRNYWRTAQAWLPRKVPEARQDVIALRQKSQDMQCRAVSKLHLVSENVVANVLPVEFVPLVTKYMNSTLFGKLCTELYVTYGVMLSDGTAVLSM